MYILGLYTHQNTMHVYLKDRIEKILSFDVLSDELPALLEHISTFGFINCVALQNGPDTFTSLRVTLALIQGFCMGINAKIYACTHFELLKDAYNITSGHIIIQNKASLLPAVQIIEGIIQPPFQVSAEETTTFQISNTINLGKILTQKASRNPWILPEELSPYYCFLPEYKTQI